MRKVTIAVRHSLVCTLFLMGAQANAQWVVNDPLMTGLATVEAAATSLMVGAQAMLVSTGVMGMVQDFAAATGIKSLGATVAASGTANTKAAADAASALETGKQIAAVGDQAAASKTDACAQQAATGTQAVLADAGNSALAVHGTMQSAKGTSAKGSGGGGANGGANRLDQAKQIALGNVSAPPSEVGAVNASTAACSAFAVNGERADQCKKAGAIPTNPSPYENADLKADTLVNGPQDLKKPAKTFGIDTTNDNQKQALDAYMTNLRNYAPLRALDAAELRSEAGRRFMQAQNAFNARLDLADIVMRNDAAKISLDGSKVTTDALKSMADGNLGAFTKSALQGATDWATKGVSPDKLLELDVQRRYFNPEWVNKTAKEPLWVAQEQLVVAAQTNVLLHKVYEEMRMNNRVSAQMLRALVTMEMRDELKRMHDQAVR